MDQEDTAKGSRFAEAARALECDEDEARFNEALRKISVQKPNQVEGLNQQSPSIDSNDN